MGEVIPAGTSVGDAQLNLKGQPKAANQKKQTSQNWVVVSNIFYFHPYLGKISILTNVFQMG